jgi:hypothetical protein
MTNEACYISNRVGEATPICSHQSPRNRIRETPVPLDITSSGVLQCKFIVYIQKNTNIGRQLFSYELHHLDFTTVAVQDRTATFVRQKNFIL